MTIPETPSTEIPELNGHIYDELSDFKSKTCFIKILNLIWQIYTEIYEYRGFELKKPPVSSSTCYLTCNNIMDTILKEFSVKNLRNIENNMAKILWIRICPNFGFFACISLDIIGKIEYILVIIFINI